MKLCLTFVLLLAAVAATPAAAQTTQKPEEMGTPQQRAACAPDVRKFCKSVKPEDGPFAYLSCLQEHQDKLHPACVKVISGAAD
jgi:hypothetical protein